MEIREKTQYRLKNGVVIFTESIDKDTIYAVGQYGTEYTFNLDGKNKKDPKYDILEKYNPTKSAIYADIDSFKHRTPLYRSENVEEYMVRRFLKACSLVGVDELVILFDRHNQTKEIERIAKEERRKIKIRRLMSNILYENIDYEEAIKKDINENFIRHFVIVSLIGDMMPWPKKIHRLGTGPERITYKACLKLMKKIRKQKNK